MKIKKNMDDQTSPITADSPIIVSRTNLSSPINELEITNENSRTGREYSNEHSDSGEPPMKRPSREIPKGQIQELIKSGTIGVAGVPEHISTDESINLNESGEVDCNNKNLGFTRLKSTSLSGNINNSTNSYTIETQQHYEALSNQALPDHISRQYYKKDKPTPLIQLAKLKAARAGSGSDSSVDIEKTAHYQEDRRDSGIGNRPIVNMHGHVDVRRDSLISYVQSRRGSNFSVADNSNSIIEIKNEYGRDSVTSNISVDSSNHATDDKPSSSKLLKSNLLMEEIKREKDPSAHELLLNLSKDQIDKTHSKGFEIPTSLPCFNNGTINEGIILKSQYLYNKIGDCYAKNGPKGVYKEYLNGNLPHFKDDNGKIKKGFDSGDKSDMYKKLDSNSNIIHDISCGSIIGKLHQNKFTCPGINIKCIFVESENIWFTPKEFVSKGGKESLKDWKRAIKIQKTNLRKLIENGCLDYYQHANNCSNQCRSNKGDYNNCNSFGGAFNAATKNWNNYTINTNIAKINYNNYITNNSDRLVQGSNSLNYHNQQNIDLLNRFPRRGSTGLALDQNILKSTSNTKASKRIISSISVDNANYNKPPILSAKQTEQRRHSLKNLQNLKILSLTNSNGYFSNINKNRPRSGSNVELNFPNNLLSVSTNSSLSSTVLSPRDQYPITINCTSPENKSKMIVNSIPENATLLTDKQFPLLPNMDTSSTETSKIKFDSEIENALLRRRSGHRSSIDIIDGRLRQDVDKLKIGNEVTNYWQNFSSNGPPFSEVKTLIADKINLLFSSIDKKDDEIFSISNLQAKQMSGLISALGLNSELNNLVDNYKYKMQKEEEASKIRLAHLQNQFLSEQLHQAEVKRKREGLQSNVMNHNIVNFDLEAEKLDGIRTSSVLSNSLPVNLTTNQLLQSNAFSNINLNNKAYQNLKMNSNLQLQPSHQQLVRDLVNQSNQEKIKQQTKEQMSNNPISQQAISQAYIQSLNQIAMNEEK